MAHLGGGGIGPFVRALGHLGAIGPFKGHWAIGEGIGPFLRALDHLGGIGPHALWLFFVII